MTDKSNYPMSDQFRKMADETRKAPNFHPHVGGEGNGRVRQQKEHTGAIPEEAVCRGSFELGTACGKCSKCKAALARIYKTDFLVVEVASNGRLVKRWGPFPSAHAAKAGTRTQRLLDVSRGKTFALLSTSLEHLDDA